MSARNTSAIYRHYPNKSALARSLVERVRRLLGEYLVGSISGRDSLDDGLPDVHEIQTGEEAATWFGFYLWLETRRSSRRAGPDQAEVKGSSRRSPTFGTHPLK